MQFPLNKHRISLLKFCLVAFPALMFIFGPAHAPVYASQPVQNSGARIPVPPPPRASGPIVPFTYGRVITNSVPIYAQPSDALTGVAPTRVLGAGFLGVSLLDPQPFVLDQRVWYRIESKEYIQADNVQIFQPSEFQGIALTNPPDKPFAWVVYGVRPSLTPGAPATKTSPSLARYTRVPILEEKQVGNFTWYRVGENQWIEQRQLGVVKSAPRPEGIGAQEKWIEVNLFEQSLAAYEGDRMVYATLIASGLPQWPTPPGLFRIWVKVTQIKMSGRDGYPDYYFLEDVPWVMFFNQAVALHGAYWHDKFGTPRSHGCVNLSPKDAQWLFNWTTPTPRSSAWALPTPESPGTWVWVH